MLNIPFFLQPGPWDWVSNCFGGHTKIAWSFHSSKKYRVIWLWPINFTLSTIIVPNKNTEIIIPLLPFLHGHHPKTVCIKNPRLTRGSFFPSSTAVSVSNNFTRYNTVTKLLFFFIFFILWFYEWQTLQNFTESYYFPINPFWTDVTPFLLHINCLLLHINCFLIHINCLLIHINCFLIHINCLLFHINYLLTHKTDFETKNRLDIFIFFWFYYFFLLVANFFLIFFVFLWLFLRFIKYFSHFFLVFLIL